MLGIDTSRVNTTLIGAFIGMFIVSLSIPVYLVFGVNEQSALLLFYLIPVTGALVAFVLDGQKQAEEMSKTHKSLGKDVQIKTKTGNYEGHLRRDGEKVILLSNARNLDTGSSLDHIFLEKNEILSIEDKL